MNAETEDANGFDELVDTVAALQMRIVRLEAIIGEVGSSLSGRASTPPPVRASGRKPAREQVEGLEVDDELRDYARQFGVDADELVTDWRDHFRGNGYKTGRHPVADARATFRRWIRESATRQKQRAPLFAKKDGVSKAQFLVLVGQVNKWHDERRELCAGEPEEEYNRHFLARFKITPAEYAKMGAL